MGDLLWYGVPFLIAVSGSIYGYRKNSKYKKEFFFFMVLLGICMVSVVFSFIFQEQGQIFQVERNDVGEGTKEISLILEAEDLLKDHPYVFSIEEQKIMKQEKEILFQEAVIELEEKILANNESLEQITGNLNLVSKLQKGLVEVSYGFEPSHLISKTGKIFWENINKESFSQENMNMNHMVKVIATLTCQEEQIIHEFYVNIIPKGVSQEQLFLEELQKEIQKENEEGQGIYFMLPKTAGGISLKWKQEEEPFHTKIFLLGLILIILRYVYEKEKKEEKEKERIRQLTRDYPEIVNQLSLLSGAGMTISMAWGKIALAYQQKKEKEKYYGAGYEEMLKTWYEIQDGVGELKAYENFGNRCNHSQYRKLSALFIQNVRKGTKGMAELLALEEKEAFAQRKMEIRKMGEEASTKLLLPMGILLLLVFGILLLPAMLSLKIG